MTHPSVGQALALRTVAIETQGCKLNQADSELIARSFVQAGYDVVDITEPADIYVVNTCTVTHQADSKARQSLRSLHRRNPMAVIVAAGCYAERSPDTLSSVNGVDLVVGNTQKHDLVRMVLSLTGDYIEPEPIGREGWSWPGAFGRTRSMLKIQEGCNQVCAYCIVPKVRGRERSIPVDVLLTQVQNRVREGFKEVVLTGTQLGSYGFDLKSTSLSDLVKRILTETDIPRLRISSLQPQEITAELLPAWQDPRLCPHFHIPLQSGSASILEKMRRRYTPYMYQKTVENIQSLVPNSGITTDVIVGFPGEGPTEFRESIKLCEELPLTAIHVFPYSMRPGTSAYYIDLHVSDHEKRRRVKEMQRVAKEKSANFMETQLGITHSVLWEGTRVHEDMTWQTGLTENYLRVYTGAIPALSNTITDAILLSIQDKIAYARAIVAPDESQ